MKFRFLKPFIVVAILVVSCSSQSLYAQARPSPATQCVSIDVVPLIYDFPLTVQYELKADPTDSWLFRLHYWPSPASTWSGFGVGAAYRFFIVDSRALTGLSAAPAADLYFFNQSQLAGGTGSRSFVAFDFGGDLAYKWIFDQFAVEPIFGLRIGFGGSIAAVTTIQPLIGCSLGYAW